ncbi:MAG: hypothetical protein AAF564_00155 [Bacteroidota bacterium]
MKNIFYAGLILLTSVAVAGCATSQTDGTGKTLSSLYEGESVQVFVEGRDKGFTPMTLRVRRSLGEYEVALKKGKSIVRQFEIGIESSSNRSPERQAVFMDLERDQSVVGLRTFGIEDLDSQNDTLYYIPHYNADLSIDDVRYGLTLIITD